MARTLIDGADQILAGSIGRASINTATTGSALITKVIAGTSISLSQTGIDAGTGDVTISVSGGPYLPLAGGTVTGTTSFSSGVTNLSNGTSNWINYGTTGVAAPSYTTRSAGTKLVLYDSLNSSSADFAIGIASGNLWQSVGVSGNQFQWYGGTTLAATLSGAGALTLTGTLSAAALSVSGAVNISGFTTLGSGNIGTSGAWFGSNATYTTGWQYVATDFAWFLRSDGATGDVVSLNVAPSGTAGATMTWTPAFSVSQTGAVSFPQTPTGGGITALFASPPTIGGTTAGAAAFTTLTTSGTVTAPTVSTNSLGAVAANIAALNASSGNVLNTVGRNRLDNGDCEVAQRTLPVTVAGAYHLDRWASGWSAGTASISQGAAAGYASRKQISAVFTGLTVGATATVVQRIESARSFDLAGQSVTVSVNAAYTVSAGSTTFQFTLFYPSVTDNFATLTTIGSATFTPSGTPGTYSAYFAVPSAATTGLEIQIIATQAGATGTLTLGLTTLQLEAGTTATQFERVDPVLHLLRCQRYFQLYLNLITFGYTTSGGSIISEHLLPVEMRASPVAAISAATYSNATTLGTNYLSQEHLRMQVIVTSTGTGWGAGTVALSADL